MEYTEKVAAEQQAHALIEDFLRRLLSGENPIPSDLYEALGDDRMPDGDATIKTRQKLTSLILNENKGRCCYCMRDINHATLEHVILNSICEQEEYSKYLNMPSELKGGSMILASKYIESDNHDVPPYPHTIAYENLLPSCDGKIPSNSSNVVCCNLYRGSKFVYPLTFRKNIHREVNYYPNGNIFWEADPRQADDIPTITKLGLDCSELRMIRRIWFYICSNSLQYSLNSKEEIIYALIADMDSNDDEMLMNFMQDNYWNILSEYKYFNNIELYTLE